MSVTAMHAGLRIEPVVLFGRAVRLEPLTLAHVDAVLPIALQPALWQHTVSRIGNRQDLLAYVDEALAEQKAGSSLPFATIAAATGEVIGSTRFGNIVPQFQRAEIGWTWVGEAWQRTAVNTEAKLLMLQHAFEAWEFRRVEFKTSARNAKSRQALLRLGAVEEGTLRQHMTHADGTMRDSVYYSILRDEWPAVKARLIERLDRA